MKHVTLTADKCACCSILALRAASSFFSAGETVVRPFGPTAQGLV